MLCGRDHYFDTAGELQAALGLVGKKFSILRLDEFTEEGASALLKKKGIQQKLPDWIPRKPLILSYLTQHGLLEEILSIDGSQGFGHAWDSFLTKISEREAMLERSVMDPQTVRSVLERLAYLARTRSSGTGPITGMDLSQAYNAETGQSAGEGVLAQLQRLPGLTQREQDPGARSFVDEDMLAALQGCAFAKGLLNQISNWTSFSPISPLSDKAISMCCYMLKKAGVSIETIVSVVQRLNQASHLTQSSSQAVADASSIALYMAIEANIDHLDFRAVTVNSAMIGKLNLEEIAVDGVEFRNCVVSEVMLGESSIKGDLRFSDCLVSKVCGVANAEGLPKPMFSESCDVETFDNMSTNNAVLRLDLPPQLKALVTILRKLYKQAGGGRKVAALYRGIPQLEVSRYVTEVLPVLERSGLVTTFNKIVHPVRKQSSRVDKILNAPALSDDPVVLEIRML